MTSKPATDLAAWAGRPAIRVAGLLFLAGSVVWGCAALGVALESFWVYRPKWLSVLVYMAMGWLIVFMVRPLGQTLPTGGVWLLVAGGLAYSLGTPFYALKRVRYTHALWHLFVLAGGVCHFLAVFLFVLRGRG